MKSRDTAFSCSIAHYGMFEKVQCVESLDKETEWSIVSRSEHMNNLKLKSFAELCCVGHHSAYATEIIYSPENDLRPRV